MLGYCIRRLILLPITLLCIILVNFAIINLAPGDPVNLSGASLAGDISRSTSSYALVESDEQYLQFREFFGLTLPLFFNTWPWVSEEELNDQIRQLIYFQEHQEQADFQQVLDLRRYVADEARFVMSSLLAILERPNTDKPTLELAMHFFIRGGQRMAVLGPKLSENEELFNQLINKNNQFLDTFRGLSRDEIVAKLSQLREWYKANKEFYDFEPTFWQKIGTFFFKTRICCYLGKIFTLDFGVLRNDPNRTVISEVVKRMKYSITLAVIPMLVTFFMCLLFGFWMAIRANKWQDHVCNSFFLVLYAIPVFVVAPFLIEKCALHKDYPGTNIPFPISGFSSPESTTAQMTSIEKLEDIFRHLTLPLVCILYGSLAVQSRFARSAFLEILGQDYIRTAWAKGVPSYIIYLKHVGRNASITLLTSVAGSLGVILGGSLIIETIFSIPGFGKFFYDAILDRDYHVIMFSALSGSFLTLIGYLIADLVYMFLDPRVTLE